MKIVKFFLTGIWGLFAFCACDSKYTLVEAFLQNGAETKLFTYGLRSSELGQSVAISGNVALVDASFSGTHVYRLEGATWLKEENLRTSEYTFDRRGLALSDNIAVVGGSDAVVVYRFNGSRWQEEARLTLGYGGVVSVSGEMIAVGRLGFVYVYRFNGSNWVEEAKLAGGAGVHDFGQSVSVNGNIVVVGAEAWLTSIASPDRAGRKKPNSWPAMLSRAINSGVLSL